MDMEPQEPREPRHGKRDGTDSLQADRRELGSESLRDPFRAKQDEVEPT
jgi:hypothetical protein